MMKRFFLAMCLLVSPGILFSQEVITAQFDERTELLSVIFRLTDAKEYNLCQFPQYAKEIDKYFADFKNDTAVRYAREIHETSVSYDAPMAFALHLRWEHDTLTLNRDVQEEANYRGRWPERFETEFLSLLNDFYRKSRFHQFFTGHQKLYAQTVQAMQEILNEIDFQWFQKFFVPPAADVEKTSYHVILSILNGPNNTCQIIWLPQCQDVFGTGCCRSNEDNEPTYQKNTLLRLLCTSLSLLWQSVNRGLGFVGAGASRFELWRQEWATNGVPIPMLMPNETFVRASVICYMAAHNPEQETEDLLKDEETISFILIRDYVQALHNMEQHRDLYPTMHAFMPQFKETLQNYDFSKYKEQQEAFLKECAHLTCCLTDGQKDVPVGEQTITITFDKPMVPAIALGYGRWVQRRFRDS